MRECNIDIPLIAIGGIAKDDIAELLECGVGGIALSGSVIGAEDPVREMTEMVNQVLKREK
jgi:thiamine-phosphate pyrophosphorylase